MLDQGGKLDPSLEISPGVITVINRKELYTLFGRFVFYTLV
jgi:hypothetical protein